VSTWSSRDMLLALVALGLLSLASLALGSEQLATGFAFSATTLAMAAGGGRRDQLPPPPRTRTRTPPKGVRPPPAETDPQVPTMLPDDHGQ